MRFFAQHLRSLTQSDAHNELVGRLTCQGFPLREQACARQSHLSCEHIYAEIRVHIVLVYDLHCPIEHLFIKGIRGQHVGFCVRMFAEFVLKKAARIDEIVAT